MGATKTDHFTKKQNSVATLAKALGHPARVVIVEHLLQHLKELKISGLIKGNIEGNSVCYCIEEAYFSTISTKVENRKKRALLESYLS
jgi:ArsR family transcriptional regulator, arsenate/arsenite/antimonite-responsive transcriptional repressor